MVSTMELFEDFFEKVKKSESAIDIYKEFGGSSIYIPSYKSVCRNKEIEEEYKRLFQAGGEGGGIIRFLAAKHGLSVSQVYAITRAFRI